MILLLCDMVSPPLPCLCNPSELVEEHSLGNILAATHVTQEIIKEIDKLLCALYAGTGRGISKEPEDDGGLCHH